MTQHRYILEMPVRTQSLSNMREHWRRRHHRSLTERLHTRAAWVKARARPLRPNETAVVKLVRIAPAQLDSDNIPPSLKVFRDQIAEDLLPGKRAGMADRDPRIAWSYAQEKPPRPRTYAVRAEITISTADPEAA